MACLTITDRHEEEWVDDRADHSNDDPTTGYKNERTNENGLIVINYYNYVQQLFTRSSSGDTIWLVECLSMEVGEELKHTAMSEHQILQLETFC